MGKAHIKVGCEAYITKGNKVLLGLRKNTFGAGTWALPGGHLEFLERADECLSREIKEEMNLNVPTHDMELLALTDDLQHDNNLHYIHITFAVDIKNKEPELAEPEYCEEWRWFPIDDMPKEIFPPHQKIFKTIASQRTYKVKVQL